MADKKTKIQPADKADVAAGQPSAEEATGELPDYTAEQIAGMKPDEITALVGNAKKFIATATQKSQEAAEARRQTEQFKAESNYYKTQAEQATQNLQKFYEQMSQLPQQQTQSAPSQPPKFDPYDPEKSFDANQKWHKEEIDKARGEFREELDKLKSDTENASLGVRTLRMEKYLEKAIPELGPDVSVEEIQIWAAQHPDADYSNMETLNQAIRERQAIWEQKKKEVEEKYLAGKEEALKGAQEPPGSAFAGEMANSDKWVNMTPAERDAEIKKHMDRAFKSAEGGGV